MASLKDIRKRIDSVTKTQKTTSAMKMVSAAKLRKSEEAIYNAIPYSNLLKHVVSSLSSRFSGGDNPLFRDMGGEKTSIILITSDRGLCGGFNTNLSKKVMGHFVENQKDKLLFTIMGRKGNDYFKRRKVEIEQKFQEIPTDQLDRVVQDLAASFIRRYQDGKLGKVFLAYNHYKSVISQEPIIEQLLPIPTLEAEESDDLDFLFEPSPDVILDRLLVKFIENRVYVSMLDNYAGEHAARMTAMDSATKNAGEMIDKLQLFYNRSRQAAITKELIEIISGAESI